MTSSQGIGVKLDQGVSTCYNGLDVHQTHDYIKLSCETYIKCILQTHGWEIPGVHKSNQYKQVLMSPKNVNRLLMLEGPMEGMPKHKVLEAQMGHSYCQVLGELIYAYVICCLDIGFAIMLLAQFAQAPAKEYYQALKNVVRYLCCMMDWGLMYWQEQPLQLLLRVEFKGPELDKSLPAFPVHDPLCLVGFVDAAHAVDIKT
jgi:hypothetical protein